MTRAMQEKGRIFARVAGMFGLLAAVFIAATAREAAAQSGTWSAVTGGNWSNSANWQGGTIASGSGNAATFSLATGTTVTLDSNYTLQSISFSTANWTLGGSGTLTFAGGSRSISSPNSGTVTVSAALSGTTWTKSGNGTLVLTNGNNSNGQITVNNGTLQVADSTVYGPGNQAITTTIMGTNGVNVGGRTLEFRYNGQNDDTSQILTMSATPGAVLFGNGAVVDVNRQGGTGTNKTIGIGRLESNSVSTVTFTGGNGYSLQASQITLQANATDVTLNPTTARVSILGSVGGFGVNAKTLTLGGTATGNTVSANIGNANGAVSLAKANSSSWTLSGSNTFSGSTSITGGLLEVASTGRFTATTGITLDGSGAEFRYNSATALARPFTLTQGTLSGTGTINTAVSVGTNAILSPGNSPGTQAFSAGLTWAPGGTYRWELAALTGVAGTTWDLLDITAGSFDLSSLGAAEGSRFALDLVTLGAGGASGPLAGGYDGSTYSFLIADFGGAGFTVPGTFSTAAGSDLTPLFSLNLANWQGPQPEVGNMSVRVNSTGTGLELIIVPEPGAVALAGVGIGLVGWVVTRRRRRK